MASKGCIVHTSKNAPKFKAAIDQLKRERNFAAEVYQQLPTRCCSCNGKPGLKTLEFDLLRQMCHDIVLSAASTLKFRFSSNMNQYLQSEDPEENSEEEKTDDEDDKDDSNKDQIQPIVYPINIGYIQPIFAGSRSYITTRRAYGRTMFRGSSMLRVRKQLHYSRFDSNSEDHKDDDNKSLKESTMTIDFSKVVENFKVITATDGCIVHSSKYLSRFHHAVNLLRRTKNFKISTYLQLSKECCSCNGKTGLNTIDLTALIDVCEKIELKDTTIPSLRQHYHYLSLPFEPETSSKARLRRTRLFIGKNGETIRALQDKYNVSVYIINKTSTCDENLHKKLMEAHNTVNKQNENNEDALHLLIMNKEFTVTNTMPIDEITQEITDKWNETSEIRRIEYLFSFDPTESDKRFQYMSLPLKGTPSLEARQGHVGRFVGLRGKNLRVLQDKYNICMTIINGSLTEKILRSPIEKQDNSGNQDMNKTDDDLYLFIRKKNKDTQNGIPINEVKQEIIKKWKEASIDHNELHQPLHLLPLPLKPELCPRTRRKVLSRFIGAKGRHIRGLQAKYNVSIRVIDESSYSKLRHKLREFQRSNEELNKHILDEPYLLIMNRTPSTTRSIPIKLIEQYVADTWAEIVKQYSQPTAYKLGRRTTHRMKQSYFNAVESIEFTADSRSNMRQNRRKH